MQGAAALLAVRFMLDERTLRGQHHAEPPPPHPHTPHTPPHPPPPCRPMPSPHWSSLPCSTSCQSSCCRSGARGGATPPPPRRRCAAAAVFLARQTPGPRLPALALPLSNTAAQPQGQMPPPLLICCVLMCCLSVVLLQEPITFADVAGVDEAKEELKEIVVSSQWQYRGRAQGLHLVLQPILGLGNWPVPPMPQQDAKVPRLHRLTPCRTSCAPPTSSPGWGRGHPPVCCSAGPRALGRPCWPRQWQVREAGQWRGLRLLCRPSATPRQPVAFHSAAPQ